MRGAEPALRQAVVRAHRRSRPEEPTAAVRAVQTDLQQAVGTALE
jgi:hypothetical protein